MGATPGVEGWGKDSEINRSWAFTPTNGLFRKNIPFTVGEGGQGDGANQGSFLLNSRFGVKHV